MKDGIVKRARRKAQVLVSYILPKELLTKVYARNVIGYCVNLKNPVTFNEKIEWYKLYFCPNNANIITGADKYCVRRFLEEHDCGKYLNELLGVWDYVEDIPWDELPNCFVLKCTHGCAYNIICSDKVNLDIGKATKKLTKWMREDFGRYNLERHYSKIKPRIVCEKYLGSNMTDYKFFCCNGKVEFMYISQGLDHDDTATISFFDRNGKPAPFRRTDYEENRKAEIPNEFYELVRLSELLAQEFPFVRVDWFDVEGHIYFSELTFAPCAGMMPFEPKEYDRKLGRLFDITGLLQATKS